MGGMRLTSRTLNAFLIHNELWIMLSVLGLLIKEILTHAAKDSTYDMIVDQTSGVLFLSAPHRGSSLATFAQYFKHLYAPSIEVNELVEGSASTGVSISTYCTSPARPVGFFNNLFRQSQTSGATWTVRRPHRVDGNSDTEYGGRETDRASV